MKDRPLITITLPSYNHSGYIEACMESLIEQDYHNIELIVIDDDSVDDTWAIIKSFKEKLERSFVNVVLHKKPTNKGLIDSLSYALSIAKGEFFFAIASDDLIKSYTISILAEYLVKNTSVGLVVGDMALINDDGEQVGADERFDMCPYNEAKHKTYCSYMKSQVPFEYGGPEFGTYKTLLVKNYIPVGFMYRTQLFRDIGGYNPDIRLDDYYTLLQIAKHSQVHFLNKELFNYRIHASNTVKNTELMCSMVTQLMKHEKGYCQQDPELHRIWQQRIQELELGGALRRGPKLRRLVYKWRNSLQKRIKR